MQQNDKWIATRREASEFFGVTIYAVDKWIENGCPRAGDGRRLYLPEVLAWRSGAAASSDGENLNPQRELARKNKEQADKTALENAVRRGELVEVSEMCRLWAEVASITKSRVLGVPTKVAPLVLGLERTAEVAAVIEETLHDALHAVRDGVAGLRTADHATAASDGERVGRSASPA